MDCPTNLKNVYVKIIFCVLLVISCSTIASANIGVSSDNRIYVFHESEPVYLNDVHDQVDHSLLATDGNGIWKLNTSIYVANSTLVIDGNSGVKELRMNSDIPIKGGTSVIMGQSTTGTAGTIIIDSTKISTWNYTINEYESDYSRMRNIWLFGGSVSNTEFVAISKLEFFNDFSSTVKNVSILNSYNGLAFNNVEDILVEDITCENISFTGLLLKSCVNVEVKNYTFINSEEFWKVHDTSANGISLGGGGHGNYVHSAIINGARWGGVYFSGGEHDSKIEDVNILYAGHNGMDVHGAFNIELRNVSVSKSFSNNYMVAGTSNLPEGTYNISFIDCSSIDSNGRGMTGDWAVSDIYIDGFRASGSNSAAIQFFNASNIYITDYASSDLLIGTAIQMSSLSGYGTENVAIIDSIISDSKWKDIWFEYNNINNNIINSKWETIGKGQSSEYSDAKYLDVIAVSARTGLQVPNSVLKINDQHRSEISSTDGYSNLKDTFDLPLGRTFLPLDDRLNSPVLKNYYRAFDGHEESFSYEVALSITASESVTLTGITPDSSWYREDPNIPTYTITAIIPDDSTSGPQITGFAPSEDNPFTAGESKKFQIWSGEALTTMKWYVDSDLRSSGSMEYNWDIETGSHTIMFTGSNANGAVVQTWEVTEGEEVPVESPVSSGTGLSFTPSGSSLTANTGESTTFVVDSGQEFTSALWYLDGNLVESNTVNHAQDWNTAGTHTVRFDGTAAAGTISRTWTAVVSEPVESEYSSISISPSTNTVAPGESFSLDVYIDPAQSLTGSQFDLHYSQLASVSSVNEGGLFSSDIFATTFEYGRIDNTLGILSHVYSAIVGSGTISQAGVMATVDMVAGSDSGVLELELANVILSDASSNPAAYAASYATVLVDTAPEFTSISAKSVDEAQSLSFIVSATDADEDDLTYTAISFPSGASFDAGTATFSWTPSEGDSGNYEAVFEVTDGYLTDTVSVSITVTPLNHVPIISLFEPADNSVFEEGSTINVNVVATDADGQSLSYVIKIDGSQVSTASSYAWETGYESAGTHSIEVTVSDGIDEVSSSGTITITDLQPRWDVNEDGIVNVLDITLVGQNYGTTYTSDYPRWDVNLDGIVNIQDLSIVAGHFGETV